MSVISIRPAQERLRNLGNTRMPDRMPHFTSPKAVVSADKSIVPNAVGGLARAIQEGGGRMLSAAFAYGQLAKKEDDDRKLAEAGAGYQKRLQDGFLGGAEADYKQLVQEGFMKGDKPLMMRNGDDLEGEGLERTETDTEQLFTKSFEDVCSKNGITGELKERFRLHVAPVNLSWSGRMAAHVATERKKNEITAADKKVEQDETDWVKDRFNAGMTKMLIDDYEHKLAVRGVTREARAVDVRKYALGLAADIARESFSGLDTEAAFDEKIRLMKEDPDGLYNDNDELRERLGPNAFSEKTIDLLITEAKLKKDQFVREQTKMMNDEVDALISKGGEAEAQAQMGQGDERNKALDDMDTQIKALNKKGGELPEGSKVRLAAYQAAARLDRSADNFAEHLMISDYLEAQKVDPNYRLYTPEERKDGKVVKKAFNRYEGDPRREKLCEKVQNMIDKESLKRTDAEKTANRDALSDSLNLLNALKLEGSISQEEASLMQAAIWSKYRMCLIAKSLPSGFGSTFTSSIQSMLSKQEANAMRKFYKAFGYAPKLSSDGEVVASERNAARKDSTDYYAPLEENGQRVESRKTRVRAYELLEYGDAFLKTLRTKGPDIDREGVVEEVISHLKANWIAGDHKKNIQAIADVAQKSTIQFRGRMGAAREGNGQKQKDTERKERRDDDSDSK